MAAALALLVLLASCGVNPGIEESDIFIDTSTDDVVVSVLDASGIEVANVDGELGVAQARATTQRYRVAPGEYLVRASAEGHVSFEGRYVVRAGSAMELSIDLPAADEVATDVITGANLTVGATPATSEVTLEGEGLIHRFATAVVYDGAAGQVDARFGVEPGSYQVAIQAPGYQAYEQVHDVSGGVSESIEVVLRTEDTAGPSDQPLEPDATDSPDAPDAPDAPDSPDSPDAPDSPPSDAPSIETAYPDDDYYASVRAFPGAEGFGANATGGRGGRIEFVTSLADSGPGSARSALEADGRRYVIPLVWGYVDLLKGMRVSGDLTYAGQFMPEGAGLAFRNVRTSAWDTISTPFYLKDQSNAIFRYLKVYRGVNSSHPDGNGDTLTLVDSSDVIVDHSAFALGNDENVNLHGSGTQRVTFQHSWTMESLHYSTHPKTIEDGVEHGAGFLSGYGAGDVTMNRTFYYLNDMRNPRLTGEGRYDLVNNYDYNNGAPLHVSARHTKASDQSSAIRINVVENLREAGPLTPSNGYGMRIWQGGTGAVPSAYLEGNLHPYRNAAQDEWAGVSLGKGDDPIRLSSRVDTPAVRTVDAKAAREEILSWGGPSFVQWGGEVRSVRDPLLERAVSAARSGGGRDRALGDDNFEWPDLPSGGIDEATFWDEYFGPWRDQYFPGRDWDDYEDGYQVIEHFLNAWVPDFPAMGL